MDIKAAILRYAKNPRQIWCALGYHHLLNWMPDAAYLKLMYYAHTGKKLDLEHPRAFSEKLQWLKLYDRRPEYTRMVDKYEVRGHIRETIGEQYLIPLLGVWDDPREIDFARLPQRFVLKCTHDSGSVRICKDKQHFDTQEAVRHLQKCLKRGTYWATREWPYKNVRPRVVAEQYMEDGSGDGLQDYKVMCFNGEPKLIQLHRGRYTAHTQDFYDTDWKRTRLSQQARSGMPVSGKAAPRPACLEEMLALSARLAQGIPQVRVDWYCVGSSLYFGELTFFDGSGYYLFDNDADEQMLGDWIPLPNRKRTAR